MKFYLVSLILGLLVGVIYGLFGVRSPAPPVIALLGLAGMLMGEQAVPLAKKWIAQEQLRYSTASVEVPARAGTKSRPGVNSKENPPSSE